MKKKRYAGGGLTQADIDAGLTQADIDAGLRAGRNERISDEDRAEALRMAGTLSDKQAADLMGREVRMPEAVPVPVAPRRAIPARPIAAVGRPEVDRALAEAAAETDRDYAPARRPTPPYVYGGPSPISDIRDLAYRGANRRAAKRAADAVSNSAFKKGGSVKSTASKRADGCAQRGKTKGRMV